jgi:glycosyltransferase involved in cell wall biosynthesis
MRILQVNTETGFRGGERQLLLLCHGLRERGVDVRVAVQKSGELEAHCLDQGIPVLPLRQASPWDPRTASRLRRALSAGEADLVHAHASHAHTAAVSALRSLGAGQRGAVPPLLVSRRVDFSIGRPPLNRFKYGRVVSRFLAISDAVAGVLTAGGVAPGRITVVRSAVPPLPPPTRSRAALRGALGVGEGELLALTTAALVDHKDHPNAVRAMARVRSGVHLIVAGEGRERAAIERCIRDQDVDARVTLLGQRDDVPDLLRAADLYVAASKLEGLNTALMDAALAGLPAVGTVAGGIPEVIADEETGLLVPRGDPAALAAAIDRLAADGPLRHALGVAAAARARSEFSVGRLVDQTLTVYREVLHG